MSVFRCSLWLLAIGLLVSCADKPAPKLNKATEPSTQVPVKPKKPKAPAKTSSGYINVENVAEVLTEFGKKNHERFLTIATRHGKMKLKLYDDTPLHRANFLMLAKDGYYDGTVFYRVVPELVIQGGDTDDTKKSRWKRNLGVYTIPNEIKPTHIHKKGALAMSRYYENNPTKRSSAWDFYIVHGRKPNSAELKLIPEANREIYSQVGGDWHLDGQHTVFGEVVEGLDVIDKIAAERCDSGDWPYEDVVIKMEINGKSAIEQ